MRICILIILGFVSTVEAKGIIEQYYKLHFQKDKLILITDKEMKEPKTPLEFYQFLIENVQKYPDFSAVERDKVLQKFKQFWKPVIKEKEKNIQVTLERDLDLYVTTIKSLNDFSASKVISLLKHEKIKEFFHSFDHHMKKVMDGMNWSIVANLSDSFYFSKRMRLYKELQNFLETDLRNFRQISLLPLIKALGAEYLNYLFTRENFYQNKLRYFLQDLPMKMTGLSSEQQNLALSSAYEGLGNWWNFSEQLKMTDNWNQYGKGQWAHYQNSVKEKLRQLPARKFSTLEEKTKEFILVRQKRKTGYLLVDLLSSHPGQDWEKAVIFDFENPSFHYQYFIFLRLFSYHLLHQADVESASHIYELFDKELGHKIERAGYLYGYFVHQQNDQMQLLLLRQSFF